MIVEGSLWTETGRMNECGRTLMDRDREDE